MRRRQSSSTKRVPGKGRNRKQYLVYEPLEKRDLLSTIAWTNRGGPSNDSDHFGAAFGANAAAARLVVDAAIDNWERIIPNFNTAAITGVPANTINVAITMEEFGNGNTTLGSTILTQVDATGRPREGNIKLDFNGSSNNNGFAWFVDSTPNDNSEFLRIDGGYDAYFGNAASGTPAFQKNDLFFVASHELFHLLGLGASSSLKLNSTPGLVTNTGILDGNGPGTLWTFDGPSIQLGLTSANGNSSFPGPVHMANGTQTIPASAQFPNGLRGGGGIGINAGPSSSRKLPSLVDSLFLRDAYGYTTVDPEQFGTFYSVLNSTTKELTVRGHAGNLFPDQIRITESNGVITTSVDRIGDLFPNFAPVDAFVTSYPVGSVSRITVIGTDADNITIDRGVTVPINVVGGATNFNSLVMVGNGINETFAVNGNSITGDLGNQFFRTTVTFSDISTIAIRGEGGSDTFNFNAAPQVDAISLFGGQGNDTFNISPIARNLSNSAGTLLSTFGNDGTDQLTLDDRNDVANRTFVITSSRVTRNNSRVTDYQSMESLVLNGGQGGDILNVQSAAAGVSLTLRSGAGNDSFNVGQNNSLSGILGNLTLTGEAGTNTVRLNDQNSSGSIDYTVTASQIQRSNGTPINIATANVILQGANTPNVFRVEALNALNSYELIGNSGADLFEIAPTTRRFGDLNSADLLIRGGADTDSLVIHDELQTRSSIYSGFGTQIAAGVGTAGVRKIRWDTTESVVFNGGLGNDVLNIEGGGGLQLPTIINGGLGADTFNLTPSTGNFDLISGLFTVVGGSNADMLIVHDTARTTANNVQFTRVNNVTQINRPGTSRPPVTFNTMESLRFNGGVGNDSVDAGTMTIPVVLMGNNGDDTLLGGSANDDLHGGTGNDILRGNAGNDTLRGDDGRDRMFGGDGNDDLFGGEGNDFLFGENDDDRLFGEGGNDTLDGGSGVNVLDEGPGQGGVVITGTAGNDVIRVGWREVNGVAQVVSMINGRRNIQPYSNGETIIVHAGSGNDLVVMAPSAAEKWQAEFHGDAGDDMLRGGQQDDMLFGGPGNDRLVGKQGNDVLVGNDGDDRLWGNQGRDLLIGGRGRDRLFGNQDDDLLIGGITSHDSQTGALKLLSAAWKSGSTYESRAESIQNGSGSVLAGTGVFLRKNTSVLDDGELDRLFGQAHRDAFFAGLTDRIYGIEGDEWVF
jgi:hypothetical protein